MSIYTDIAKVLTLDGGEGSGHFRHRGIPYHLGGSARSGGFFRTMNKKKDVPKYNQSSHEYSFDEVFDSSTRRNYVKEMFKKTGQDCGKDNEKVNALSDDMYKSLSYYCNTSFKKIRNAYVKANGKDEYKKYSNTIDDFVYVMPKFEGKIYRGIVSHSENSENVLGMLKALSRGKVIDMSGASSWSYNSKEAESFASRSANSFYSDVLRIVFEVENKSGARVNDISSFKNECEVVCPTTARYELAESIDEILNDIENKKYDGKNLIHVKLKELEY